MSLSMQKHQWSVRLPTVLTVWLVFLGSSHGLVTQHDTLTAAAGDLRNHYHLFNNPKTPSSINHARFAANDPNVPAANASAVPTGALTCSSGSPCIDGSCCGPNNICGFGPTYCGTGCQSNCEAKSICGRDSAGGNQSCGMNLCCSYYGWCGYTPDYCTPGPTGCQQGFGSCSIPEPPKCDPSSGSATKRSIGYYFGGNVHLASGRQCQTVKPSQINVRRYTHLYWAFADIDPQTFQIVPTSPGDEDLYRPFTALSKPGGLQTWISMGGFDFTTANPSTFTKMVSSPENRKAYIDSLIVFMTKYGFQGVDFD